jgi:hypothetical protein
MRPSIVKRIRTAGKILYVIYFNNKGLVVKFLCRKVELAPAGLPQTGLKYLRLFQDIAPAHKARIETEFLKAFKLTVLPNPAFSQASPL